ncbi:hypothetical protein L6E12_26870 [Actinokineospora sp. PR83]|uniref:hypothetical protein n=1 Tax=Actinokineospora sp. PR83 TaxID=2884908 RepID=UPI001F341101|nr:hypothetical protein [Actinokineospora sp. PR83]MCG8919403.1 hypothetical protein [Actinokineospora sp. PR83]
MAWPPLRRVLRPALGEVTGLRRVPGLRLTTGWLRETWLREAGLREAARLRVPRLLRVAALLR